MIHLLVVYAQAERLVTVIRSVLHRATEDNIVNVLKAVLVYMLDILFLMSKLASQTVNRDAAPYRPVHRMLLESAEALLSSLVSTRLIMPCMQTMTTKYTPCFHMSIIQL